MFDLELKRKSGAQSITLSSIEKAELGSLKEYFTSKNVQVEIDDEQKKIQQQLENLESIDVSDDSREQGP